MHSYQDGPHITLDMEAAYSQLRRFISDDVHKKINDVGLFKESVKVGLLKMTEYQRTISVNMEKEEILRDICFLAGGMIEKHVNTSNISVSIYKAMIAACFDIVEAKITGEFSKHFIEKIMRAYSIYWSNYTGRMVFNSTAVYLMFKSHLRVITEAPGIN